MKKQLICVSCGKKVNCSETGYLSRMRKYKDEEDMKLNFTCRTCRRAKKN